MFNFENVYSELYTYIIILALIFYLISSKKIETLVSIIIIIIIGYYLFIYLQELSEKKELIDENNVSYLNNSIKDREKTPSNNYIIGVFPKNIKYIQKNEELMNMLLNIKFVKKFDRNRYADLINICENLMKEYIFILAERYDPREHLSIFIDLRYNALETLYSFFVIVPKKLNYIYGIDTYKELYDTIDKFRTETREMITTIENFAKIKKKIIHLDDNKYRPYNTINSMHLVP